MAAWLPGTTGEATPATTPVEQAGVSRIMLAKARIEDLLLASSPTGSRLDRVALPNAREFRMVTS